MKRMALGALLLAGCAGEYIYVPAENATARVGNQEAASYQIPPEQPRGDVRVASFGVTKVKVNEQEHVRAMHVRMIVNNNGDQAWSLDTRQQLGVLPNEGRSRPLFASVSNGQMPIVTIAPHGQVSVDLFYPLPQAMQKASKLPEFDLQWSVNTNTRLVAERTPFQRIEIEPVYAYDYGYGYWPYGAGPYWYDPYFFDYTFAHPVAIHHPIHHRGYYVTRPYRRF